ncbi:two-component system LytT family sensor kinase [Chryseobacterium ginsenosidimutans]|uniref:sensor histidine kinase n=1 Tax=Chryseobacterium ginsenosidimutans TaxID=687846 RepID=UPI0027879570|nr:histidine kinase [Chryseobacterium ginsenosidimutans]MDQ0592476.1 two-component system LytT family sensor kinase [Chryseobacterium ginsenosidimutans]
MKITKLLYLHIFFWSIYIIGAVLIPYFVFGSKNTIFNITFFITSIICFYVNYFVVVPKFFDGDKIYKSVIVFFLSASCFVGLRYCMEEWFLPTFFGIRNYAEGIRFIYYYFDNIFYSSTTIFISTTFWFFRYFIKTEVEKTELVKAKKNAELQALKTQINPHFIFNSLNNIYSLVYQNSDKALPAIEELSQLLRYTTKDLEKDVISLDKEIGYIDSLTALEKLRIKNPELLIMEKNINHPKLNISPMILVPFVENAFKHGDFRNKGFAMKLSDENQILHFHLLNYKKDRMKDSLSGIGIENVKKRLAILYPKKHELNIKDSETEFIVDLKIDLRNE